MRRPLQPELARQRYCSRACGDARRDQIAGPNPAYDERSGRRTILLREIAETSYVAVGRKYGVSDNAIRKWVRQYEREAAAAISAANGRAPPAAAGRRAG